MEHHKNNDFLNLTWVSEEYGEDTEILHFATSRVIYNVVLKYLMKNIYLKDASWIEIDWIKYEDFSFSCDVVGYDACVKNMFQKSILNKYKFIILEIGISPILKINTKYFFDHWWKLLTSNGQGVYAFTEDGNCVIECRNHSIIYSNFPIFDEKIDEEFWSARDKI